MKRFLLLTLLLLLIPLSTGFTEQITRVDSNIDFGEEALFDITLTNDEDTSKTVRLGLGVADASSWLISPTRITIPPESTVTETVRFIPRTNTGGGAYFLDLRLTTRDAERVVGLPISLGRGERGFSPSVSLFVRHDEQVDPRQNMEISTELVNRNQRDYEQLQLDVASELFETSFNLSLDGLAREGRNLYIPLNRNTRPGTYNLSVTLSAPGETRDVSEFDSTFTIQPYTDITISSQKNSSFLKNTYTITVSNEGNSDGTHIHNVTMSQFDQLFTSTTPEAQAKTTDGVSMLQWNISSPSQEQKIITYTTNYRPLAIGITALIITIILYFLLRSPVIIKKETSGFTEDTDTLKIRIHIRNRSSKDVHNVTVRDKLDGILQYVEADEIGYISPTYAKKKKSGQTSLRWDLNTLDSYEERVFVYEAKPRLDILGDLTLQRSQVRFEDDEGSVRITTSNTVSVGEKTGFIPRNN